MHPELVHRANQARHQDLRREADTHRRDAWLLGGRRTRASGTAVPSLSPAVHSVLLFAEHEPTTAELDRVLEQLKGLRDDVVTALLHHRPVGAAGLSDEAGTHSLTLPAPAAVVPAQRTAPEAERLSHVVGVLRAAGHETTGELVGGPPARALLSAVRAGGPEAVILLPDRHRLAHLAHRDLEQRLRRVTSTPVLTLSATK